MIDISMLAPAAQVPASQGNGMVANSTKESAPGAQGFLRLFEIVLDGMPRPVKPESGELLAGSSASAADPDALLAGANVAMDVLAPDASALPDAASLQIANLLRGLGFDVDANQIMALGPLDRMQLDQAMEFLQRGLEAGMATGELLENASFLMPREWDYQGPQSSSIPRSEGLAVSAPEAQGLDPAQILAATEAVRQMLALSMPGAVAAQPNEGRSVQNTSVATAPGAQGDGSNALTKLDAAAMDPVLMNTAAVNAAPTIVAVANAARVADAASSVPSKVGSATTPDGSRLSSEGDPIPATETDAPTVLASAFRQVPNRPDRSSSSRGVDPAIRIPTAQASDPTVAGLAKTAQVERPEAIANSAPSVEAGARGTDASNALSLAMRAQAPPAESRIATAEGVKPGSMASEFIGRQVLEKVDVHLRQGKRELTVRLWPDELGEVRLSLRIGEADKLDARILVQNEGVRQALLDATPQLREALARHGMDLGRLSVNVDSGRSEAHLAEGDRRDPGGREGRRETPQRGWREQEIEYAGALALGVDSGIRDGRNTLDMWS